MRFAEGKKRLYEGRQARVPDGLKIHFERLGELDPIAVLEPSEMTRNMTKTGIFRAIEPLA